MPLWATILLIAVVIVLILLVYLVIKVHEQLKKVSDYHTALTDWLDQVVLKDLQDLCNHLKNGTQPANCPGYAGRTPPPPPDYP